MMTKNTHFHCYNLQVNMKSVGVIGTGTKAAIWYYETIQKIASEKFGDDFVCPIKLIGVPFAPINAILPYKIKQAGELMIPYFKEMEGMECEKYILANITLHEGVEENKFVFTPNETFIGLDKIVNEYLSVEAKNIMIIGTAFTMEHTFLPNLISKVRPNINCVHPNESTFQKMDKLRSKFYNTTDASLAKSSFNELQNEYPDVDLFVIACTEHALALDCIEDKSRFFNLPYLQCLNLVGS